MGTGQFDPELFELIDWLKENIGDSNTDWNISDSNKGYGVIVAVYNEANAALVKLRWG